MKSAREGFQEENKKYREFIQEERAEHQIFLERTYKITGIVVTVVIFFLGFFGWNTFKGIQDSRKKIEEAATGRLVAFENSMNDYRTRFNDAQQNLKLAESDYNQFLSYYKDINPIKGRYLLIGATEKLEVMKTQEVPRFEASLGKLELLTTDEVQANGFYEGSYDVIIYRYSPNDKGEDAVLESILQKLKAGVSIPVLVYSVGQSERIGGSTYDKLVDYGLFNMATNPVTLIDNAASTYRVSKLSVPKISKPA